MDLMPQLRKGIPVMGIPPLEPIHIPMITVDSGPGGDFQFDIRGKNADFHGLTNMKVQKAKMDVDKNLFTLEFTVDNVNITGQYGSTGKLLNIDVDGSGDMFFYYSKNFFLLYFFYIFIFYYHFLFINLIPFFSLENPKLVAEWEGTKDKKADGKEYFVFKSKKFDLTVEKGSYGDFGTLFKDDPEKTASTNKLFNEHFVEAYNEFKPSLCDFLGKLVTIVVNSIHDKFPIDTLYPA